MYGITHLVTETPPLNRKCGFNGELLVEKGGQRWTKAPYVGRGVRPAGPRRLPRDITERPHIPSGVAAFMSAHSKTPYTTPSMDFKR